jgi:DNA-directed RNA polymerase subunit RPC12/RpoP
MKCQKEVLDNINVCDCSSRSFIMGKVTPSSKGFNCICGSDVFNLKLHMDYEDKAVNVYQCPKCNQPVRVEYYRGNNGYWK